MRKMLMILVVLVSLAAMMTAVAHAEGRPMLSPTSSDGGRR